MCAPVGRPTLVPIPVDRVVAAPESVKGPCRDQPVRAPHGSVRARSGHGLPARADEPEDHSPEDDALPAARSPAYPARERLGQVVTQAVRVPKGYLPEMLGRIEKTAARHDIVIADGHARRRRQPTRYSPLPRGDYAAKDRAQTAFDETAADATALGGTATGQHGAGLLKRPGLAAEAAPEVMAVHHAVNRAPDPYGGHDPGTVPSRRRTNPAGPTRPMREETSPAPRTTSARTFQNGESDTWPSSPQPTVSVFTTPRRETPAGGPSSCSRGSRRPPRAGSTR
ncbi:FAD-linked oxidase C-terminal domain-containing protein [Streptomyces sp. NPDC046925]|uniref:FAD-linked oxidase C-terminal domain-containing protein n=1 Tax=Streptomyces sp. NPDC046925 TaxID=3155375 RepID=UPI0033F37FB4